ncbi:hypothetical protein AbHV_ORF49 [Abalone herpesvirus Victoria/AUS/2009]|uniref:Uncharacterized protein n=2 Tax=Aurivirus haliotidmalaco1 TaxID=3050290 RepID=K4JUH4_ABHV|nr:hypothetical protein AbHV_ORF49 [Abalone herpesvirus Victoria/AUS/2009]ADL16669.1 AbHVp038c [Abalone herpesvirus Victoria/AUS/2007]AFU90059.1 hypothetical protein AbHV_ORF49 [Abalone herpesvirus Victoria/AUS/2009]
MELPRSIKNKVFGGTGIPPRPVLKVEATPAAKGVPPIYNVSGLDQPIDRQINRVINAEFDDEDRLVISIWDPYATLKDRSVLIEVGRAVTTHEFELYEDPAYGCTLVVENPNKWLGQKDVQDVYDLVAKIYRQFYTAVLNSDNKKQALSMTIKPSESDKKKSLRSLNRRAGKEWEIAPDVVSSMDEVLLSEQLRKAYLS